jgi:hypothetical protein
VEILFGGGEAAAKKIETYSPTRDAGRLHQYSVSVGEGFAIKKTSQSEGLFIHC